ncbi:hypothetical protein [Azohydromonas caseinilytica]|uniref:Uncharacterized protein n=1 Tax=Azohydromonas caseinilytica TaxID=2728836 RepID=A0A848FJ61_9BURK|nr:hypothetical protein [Azohydromonas caseinilytica]NML19176.1 hypothetical protein [Azohydromonas caseinilytica]
MEIEKTEKAFRQYLRREKKLLKELGARDILHIATEFWLSNPVDGLRADEGDGLVAYFELLDRRGIIYEFGVNRVMRIAEEPSEEWHAWSPAWKLRISIGFKPTPEIFQLKPSVVSLYSCWDRKDFSSFLSEVEESPPFKLVLPYVQHSSSIALSECNGPSGAVNHPTQGLSWAIA